MHKETKTTRQSIASMIDSNKSIRRFLDLTSIPGVSCQEGQIISYLKAFLKDRGLDCQEDDAGKKFNGEAGNLICKISSSSLNSKTILLAAHIDTISLSCENPEVSNGKIISSDERILGADDRVGVNILLQVLELIAHKKIDYPNLEIVFLVAEEIGLKGSKYLDYSQLEANYAFNFDCSAPVGHVVTSAPKVIDFELVFVGRSAHSAAAPENGINAISMAAETISALDLPQKSNDVIFNIGKITGGEKNNIIPAKVSIFGEIRSFNPKNITSGLQKMRDVAQSVCGRFRGDFKLKEVLRYEAFQQVETAPVCDISKKAIENTGLSFLPIRYLGGSDANNFNENQIDAVNLGLGYQKNHSSDEFILVADLLKGIDIGVSIVQAAASILK